MTKKIQQQGKAAAGEVDRIVGIAANSAPGGEFLILRMLAEMTHQLIDIADSLRHIAENMPE